RGSRRIAPHLRAPAPYSFRQPAGDPAALRLHGSPFAHAWRSWWPRPSQARCHGQGQRVAIGGRRGCGPREGRPAMTPDTAPAYGLWLLAFVNAAVFIIFALSFTKPQTSRDWRSFGAFSAFLVALFAEMYGFPLTI